MQEAAKIFDKVLDVLALLAGLAIVFQMIGICADVSLRYLAGRPVFWMIDMTSFSLLYVAFLATPWLLREEGHVKIDIVFEQLGLKAQFVMNLVTSLLGIGICSLITWYGIRATWISFDTGCILPGELHAPKWPLLAIIPLGSLLLSVQFVRRTYRYFPKRH